MTYKDDGRYIEKRVDPTDHILNDNDVGVDYLGHRVYAEALAETISNVKTPVTIGVFARWGSGKSFLVKHVCNILRRRQMQGDHMSHHNDRFNWIKCFLVLLVPTLFFGVCLFLALIPITPLCDTDIEATIPSSTVESNSSSTPANSTQPFNCKQVVSLAALVSSSSLALLLLLMLCCIGRCPSSLRDNLKLLFIAAFAKLPVSSEEKAIVGGDEDVCVIQRAKSDNSQGTSAAGSRAPPTDVEANQGERKPCPIAKRYILVNFNAWAYEGSDNLWAGIATNISEAVEKEFGSMASRLFRLLDIETVSQEPESHHAVKSRQFFAKFGANPRLQVLEEVLKSFGVLCRFERYTDWRKQQGKRKQPAGCESWWVVEYCSKLQTQTACENIKKGEVEVQFTDPFSKKSTQVNTRVKQQNGTSNGRIRTRQKGVTQTGINMATLNGQDQSQQTESSRDDETPIQDGNSGQNTEGRIAPEPCEPLWGCWKLFQNFPKTKCHVPVLVWAIVLVFVLLVLIPVASYATAASQAIPVAANLYAWVPGVVGVLSSVCGVVWAMFHSQTSRITSALQGTKSDMDSELGVMDKIKYEINVISKLIQCTRFSHGKEYKIVLAIDDLDRISQHKVKSVLQAVNILLSDRSSPFVCMIAVDPRIAVNCLENEMSETLLQANVNGHEYIKKIINLPFCLPDVGKKKQFIEGLISEADNTSTVFKKFVEVDERYEVEDTADTAEDADASGASRPQSALGNEEEPPAPGAPGPRAPNVLGASGANRALGAPPSPREPPDAGAGPSNGRSHTPTPVNRNKHGIQPRLSSSSDLRMSDDQSMSPSHTIPALEIKPPTLVSNRDSFSNTNYGYDEVDAVVFRGTHRNSFSNPNRGYDEVDAAVFRGTSRESLITTSEDDTSVSQNSSPSLVTNASIRSSVTMSSDQESTVERPPATSGEASKESKLGTKDFLYECKKCFHEDDVLTSHLHSNPRNIKRIFNVLTLTAAMINCKYKVVNIKFDPHEAQHWNEDAQQQHYFRNAKRLEEQQSNARGDNEVADEMDADARTKSLAQKIARWVVLTDQWPYRTSYILQVIEDADQRSSAGRKEEHISNDMSLHKIYERRVRKELRKTDLKNNRLLALDGDADTFYSYLKSLGAEHMSKEIAKSLLKYTINLDHSIRLTISKEREEMDMTRESTTTEAPRPVAKVKQNRKRRRQQSGQPIQKSPVSRPKVSPLVLKPQVPLHDSQPNFFPQPQSQLQVNASVTPKGRRSAGDLLMKSNPNQSQQTSPKHPQTVGSFEIHKQERKSSYQPTDDHYKTSPEVDHHVLPSNGYLPGDLFTDRLASV